MDYSLILLSAGKGVRLGNNTPKQYLMLAGKPMIVHTLERADAIDEFREIVIVCNDEYIDIINGYIKNYNIKKKVIFSKGGATRQESVYNGMTKATCENIVIHEAARPFVAVDDFKRLIACPFDNVTFTYYIPYTVLKKNDENIISDTLNREELVNIQLPQKFTKSDLMSCHIQAKNDGKVFTEDAGLMKHYSDKPVFCLEGNVCNIKITEYTDMLFGEILYKEKFLEESL